MAVPTDDVELSLSVAGDGPFVLMMRGFPDTLRTWNALQATLVEAGFRAATLALRGYAPSSLSREDDYSLSALVRDVIAVPDQEGRERAVLAGHDWGASVAYATAALHPSRVDRMVTLAIPPLSVFPTGWREAVARPHNPYLGWGRVSGWLLHRQRRALVERLYR